MGSVSIRLMNFPSVADGGFSHELTGETSLYELLSEWGGQCAPSILKRLFEPESGGVAATILILLNGRSVKSDDPKTTMVSPGDEITIAPILLGG